MVDIPLLWGFAYYSLAEIYEFIISAMTTSLYKNFQGLKGRTVQIVLAIHNMENIS